MPKGRTLNKYIMNPAKIDLLRVIRAKGETNRKVVGANAIPGFEFYIKQLIKAGLVLWTGGGYFQTTPQGCEYLDSLEEPTGTCIAIG
jgi:predicted transcriptional regulator